MYKLSNTDVRCPMEHATMPRPCTALAGVPGDRARPLQYVCAPFNGRYTTSVGSLQQINLWLC